MPSPCKIVYDPSQVTYGQLLKVFFSVAHDPTELNRQGPDEGTQYRSVHLLRESRTSSASRRRTSPNSIRRNRSRTKLSRKLFPSQAFYPAEAYHQDFAVHNPDNPYIMINDLPKVEHLKKQLPELYVKKTGG